MKTREGHFIGTAPRDAHLVGELATLRPAPEHRGFLAQFHNQDLHEAWGWSWFAASDFNLCRRGEWLQTFTGKAFWPLDPLAEDVDIVDIAHSLSMTCRYRGHSKRFYSVAEHCVLMSYQVPSADMLWALLHDAAEAYSADVPRPLKRHLAGWPDIESGIMAAVCQKFGLPLEQPASVTHADTAMLMDEKRVLLGKEPMPWGSDAEALGVTIECWHPGWAKSRFLRRFRYITDTWDAP